MAIYLKKKLFQGFSSSELEKAASLVRKIPGFREGKKYQFHGPDNAYIGTEPNTEKMQVQLQNVPKDIMRQLIDLLKPEVYLDDTELLGPDTYHPIQELRLKKSLFHRMISFIFRKS